MTRYVLKQSLKKHDLKVYIQNQNGEPKQTIISTQSGETIAIVDEVNSNHVDILRLNKLQFYTRNILLSYTSTPIAER